MSLPGFRSSHRRFGQGVVRHRDKGDHAGDGGVEVERVLGVAFGHGAVEELRDGDGAGLWRPRHDALNGEGEGLGRADHVAPRRQAFSGRRSR